MALNASKMNSFFKWYKGPMPSDYYQSGCANVEIDQVTTFACALAKHRKSATLEAKDILLHLERNWQLTIPGFTGEEFKTHKRSSVSETHLQRLAMIQKSMTASQMENEAGNIKGTTGQVIGSSNAGVQVAKVSQSTAPVIPSSTGSPGVHKVPRLF
eukprot:Gb_24182 [translate_table: standard]